MIGVTERPLEMGVNDNGIALNRPITSQIQSKTV